MSQQFKEALDEMVQAVPPHLGLVKRAIATRFQTGMQRLFLSSHGICERANRNGKLMRTIPV